MGTKVLVYTDGDQAKADALARQLADEVIAMRDGLAVNYPSIDASLDEALAFDGGPVVLADGADNPGGGAASDSTFILRRMVERGIANAALGPLWDPIAVRIAFDAGVGAQAGDAHRRQDQPALGRSAGCGMHREGAQARPRDDGPWARPRRWATARSSRPTASRSC
jgi:hypothetical protein